MSAKGRIGRTQNLGIAKKRWEESHPCQDYFVGFDIMYRGQPEVIINPPKVITVPQTVMIFSQTVIRFPKIVTIHPQLVNIFPKMNFHPQNMLIYGLCLQLLLAAFSHLLTSNLPMCQIWGRGAVGGWSQFWHCQDFESACSAIMSLYRLVSNFWIKEKMWPKGADLLVQIYVAGWNILSD